MRIAVILADIGITNCFVSVGSIGPGAPMKKILLFSFLTAGKPFAQWPKSEIADVYKPADRVGRGEAPA